MPPARRSKPTDLDRVKTAIDRARDALAAFDAAAPFAPTKTWYKNAEEAWSTYLVLLKRVWSNLAGGLVGADAHRYQSLIDEQKADPLLTYLFQARNALEHPGQVVLQLEVQNPVIVPIDPNVGPRVVRENDLGEVEDVKVAGQLTAGDRRIALSEVVNRGVTYSMPETHLGAVLVDRYPSAVGALGLAFLEAAYQRVRAELVARERAEAGLPPAC
jgi:hypothetical protein